MKKYVPSIALLLVLILALVGCSSSKQQTTGDQQTKAVPEVKIGMPYPLTGVVAEQGNNSVRGIKLAMKEINDAGGIKALGGAKLVPVEGDTGSSDPAMAASVTRRLVTNDKVVALLGCYASNMTMQASTEAEKGQVPMLSESFTDQLSERGYKYYFQLPAKNSQFGQKTVDYVFMVLEKEGIKVNSVALASSNDAAVKGQSDAVKKEVESRNCKVSLDEHWPPGSLTDATALVTKIKNANPDVIIGGSLGAGDLAVFLRTLRASGIKAPFFNTAGGQFVEPSFGESMKQYADGSFGLAAWNHTLPYKGLEDMVKKFTAAYGVWPSQEAGEAYIMTYILKDAIEKAGKADPKAIRDALAGYQSNTGPAAWMTGGGVKFGPTGCNEMAVPVMIEWKDNQPHAVWPPELQSMQPFFLK